MGCFWSCEEGTDRCQHCNRKPVNNLRINNGECEICLQHAARPRESVPLRPLLGEFRCSCRRQWVSRRSYRGFYQICRRCKKHVYARLQRELRPGDISCDQKNVKDHPKELCQMCIELGYYCGKLRF